MSLAAIAALVVVGVVFLSVWILLIAAARAAARGDAQIDRQDARPTDHVRLGATPAPDALPSVEKTNRFARRSRAQRAAERESASESEAEADGTAENGSSVAR